MPTQVYVGFIGIHTLSHTCTQIDCKSTCIPIQIHFQQILHVSACDAMFSCSHEATHAKQNLSSQRYSLIRICVHACRYATAHTHGHRADLLPAMLPSLPEAFSEMLTYLP